MPAKDFGAMLRAEREKRGISLHVLSSVTKVSVELWNGMERNDFSRWPSGVAARGFVREYAAAVGLDADAVVDEFCRQFPIGNRRAASIVAAQAELIGHHHEWLDTELLPAGHERRVPLTAEKTDPSNRVVYGPRIVAAALDAVSVTSLSLFGVTLLGEGFFLSSMGASALLYFTASTIATGASPGVHILAAVRHRAPALFTDRPVVSA